MADRKTRSGEAPGRMYLEHFELNKPPFQLTPDASFLYLSPQHAKAKAHMEYAVVNRDSCVVVTGEVGCGKTTLINGFLREIGDDVRVARLFQTQISTRQFLQTLLAQFGIEAYHKNKAELLADVSAFLMTCHKRGEQVVLIVDEAQNLSLRVLEEIRLLTDIETETAKAINIILCGQPELSGKLQQPEMEQVLQRVRFQVHLEALSMVEMSEYIDHRLRVAGWRKTDSLFPTSVMPLLFRYTGGVPRLINTLCDTVLTAAYVDDVSTVGDDLVLESIRELDWGPYEQRTRSTDQRTFPTREDTPPKLVLLREGEILRRHILEDRRVLIGRDADNDVPIASEFVSRHHAQISFYRGAYWIMDLKSTNGTYVNGKPIRRCRLRDRDIVALGHHRIVFQNPLESADTADANMADISDFQSTSVLDPDAVAADTPKSEAQPPTATPSAGNGSEGSDPRPTIDLDVIEIDDAPPGASAQRG
ncbi:MAG: AAA family ATPase [Pseudomonadota bacterium]